MSGITSLGIAASGMRAAQAGLYVTGHNMSNADTVGYTRQRVLQKDFSYLNIGHSGSGAMKVGLGTDIGQINQIRYKYYDMTYRQEVSKLGFYNAMGTTGNKIESVIGELQSEYNTQTVFQDLWDSLNELSSYQSGLETRSNFVSTAITLVDKANNVYKRLSDYQHNLDKQVRQTVTDVNMLLSKIEELNQKIVDAEASGDNANDYRDSRNTALDDLSVLIKITYSETPSGRVDVQAEGHELISNGHVTRMGLKYISPDYSFVEPVFTDSLDILPSDTPPGKYRKVFSFENTIDPSRNNDYGTMKALLLSRGFYPANYASSTTRPDPKSYPNGVNDTAYIKDYTEYYNTTQCMIPNAMHEFDKIFNAIITKINNALAPVGADNKKDPNAPYDLAGNQTYLEIFVRNGYDRFDANGNYNAPIEGPPPVYKSLYSIGNIKINPELQKENGYTFIPLSKSGDLEDTQLVLDLLEDWNKGFIDLHSDGNLMNVGDAYNQFITKIGNKTQNAKFFVENQAVLVEQTDSKRYAMSGVSLDEEMKNMMTYQHAYNAAARVFNTIDSMLDKLINGTGMVGR